MSRRPPSAAHSTSSDFQQHEVPTTSSNGGGSGIKLKLSLGRHHPENLGDPNAGDHDHDHDDNDDHDDEMVGGGHGRVTRTAASAGGVGVGGIATRSRNSGGRRASASASSTASSPQQRRRTGAGGAGGGRVTRSAVGGGSINYNEDAAAAAVDDDDRDGDDLGIFDDDQDAPAARAASTRSRRSTTALNGGSRGGGGGGSGRRRSNNSGGDDVGEDDEDAEGEPDEREFSFSLRSLTLFGGPQLNAYHLCSWQHPRLHPSQLPPLVPVDRSRKRLTPSQMSISMTRKRMTRMHLVVAPPRQRRRVVEASETACTTLWSQMKKVMKARLHRGGHPDATECNVLRMRSASRLLPQRRQALVHAARRGEEPQHDETRRTITRMRESSTMISMVKARRRRKTSWTFTTSRLAWILPRKVDDRREEPQQQAVDEKEVDQQRRLKRRPTRQWPVHFARVKPESHTPCRP